jgi:hypothetical protein
MRSLTSCGALIAVSGLFLSIQPTPALAETVNCTPINAVPATISTPGSYCLTKNLTAPTPLSFSAIQITANDVTLDLNGFKLTGTGSPGPNAQHDMGIFCAVCKNVTIRNGTVAGFDTAIRLGDTFSSELRGNIIEQIRATRNTRLGIAAMGAGIIVRDNLILQTGGDIQSGETCGICVSGVGIRVINNDIETVRHPATTGKGIDFVTGGAFRRPADNIAINNRITDTDVGIRFLESEGKYRDNVTSSVSTPYIGGTNIGNNF